MARLSATVIIVIFDSAKEYRFLYKDSSSVKLCLSVSGAYLIKELEKIVGRSNFDVNRCTQDVQRAEIWSSG